jgi:DNA-binding CsgD family transcriptional regulator
MNSKVKVKVAEIETTLELFVYWLERDFPRVKELKWLELRAMDDPKANPLFERKWWATFAFPVFTIVAQTMTPGKVSTAWGLSPFNVGLTDIPDPIDAMGKWVEFRFGVVATTPEEETPANERAMLGLLPDELLTDTQKQVANLVADGLTQSQIASELFINVSTVKTHKRQIRLRRGIAPGGSLKTILKSMGFGTGGR